MKIIYTLIATALLCVNAQSQNTDSGIVGDYQSLSDQIADVIGNTAQKHAEFTNGQLYAITDILQIGSYTVTQPAWYSINLDSLFQAENPPWSCQSSIHVETHIQSLELITMRRLFCLAIGLQLVALTKHGFKSV